MEQAQVMLRDGYAFTALTREDICDALIIRETPTASCVYPPYSAGTRTVEECVDYINANQVESAVVIANDLSILKRCPSVRHFVFYPNRENGGTPQLSYLSMLPGIRSFHAGADGVDELYTGGTSPLVFQKLKTLKQLNMWGVDDTRDNRQPREKITSIEDLDLPALLKFSISQCTLTTLRGIQNCPRLQWVDMEYMRTLSDISDLASLAPTLRLLSIENCPRITDFGVIARLKELEYLELKGKNELPNLDFIRELPKLKLLNLSMNVLDGDLSCLRNIQYADVVCKRHYNLKNKDLPKDRTGLGFEFV